MAVAYLPDGKQMASSTWDTREAAEEELGRKLKERFFPIPVYDPNRTYEAMQRIRTLRQLQAAPDELLCDDPELAQKHQLKVPFWISGIEWKGSGVLCVDIKSNTEGYYSAQGWPVSEYTSLRYVIMPDQPPKPEDLPTKPPAWEALRAIVAAAVRVGERMFTGPTHFDAVVKIAQIPNLNAEEKVAMLLGGEAGFVTDEGQFVNREQAKEISQKQV